LKLNKYIIKSAFPIKDRERGSRHTLRFF